MSGLDQYDRVKVLGKGTYGKAWLVKDRTSQQPYVMKEIKVNNQQELDEALAEAEVLSKIAHINITRYVNLIRVSPKCVCIVMEFADDGDLAELIGKRKAVSQPLEEETILRILVQVTQALHYIHARGILHRDVKTANVFLNKSGVIKLGDFGIARILEDHGEATISARTCRTPVGTPLYMSPELCLGERYGPKSDIWALGCVLYEMSAMKSCFVATSLEGLMAKIRRGQREQKIPKIYSPELIGLVGRLLSQDAKTRPAAKEILILPFLQKYIRDAPATLAGLYVPPVEGAPATAEAMLSPFSSPSALSPVPQPLQPYKQLTPSPLGLAGRSSPAPDIMIIQDQRSPPPVPIAKPKRDALRHHSMVDVRAQPKPSLPPLLNRRAVDVEEGLGQQKPLSHFSRMMSGSDPNLAAQGHDHASMPAAGLRHPGPQHQPHPHHQDRRLSQPVLPTQVLNHDAQRLANPFSPRLSDVGVRRAGERRAGSPLGPPSQDLHNPASGLLHLPNRNRSHHKDLAQLSDYYHQHGIKNISGTPATPQSGTPQHQGGARPQKLPSLF